MSDLYGSFWTADVRCNNNVDPNTLYLLPPPEFLGVISFAREGHIGTKIFNPKNIVKIKLAEDLAFKEKEATQKIELNSQ